MTAYRNPDAEQALEDATIDLFSTLHYTVINAYDEVYGKDGTLGRNTLDEVVLVSRLLPMLQELNPDLPDAAIADAVEQLTRDRSLMTVANANREIYLLLKNGVKATFKLDDGEEHTETVKVIDWNTPENNDFLVVQQFWVLGLNGLYKRRADLVLFINGLPLVFIELKAAHRNVQNAYQQNLRDYRDTIPQIFWYNAFIILSNGSYGRMGSITATWEYFVEWKRISNEQEAGVVDLDTMIQGTCEQSRLLDLIENFTLFRQSADGLKKLVGQNHQFLGVNNAIRAVEHIRDNQGRLGVFWHTQGSGKSYSMVFFSQKVLRKLFGDWTFLIVTDREELDEQIYQNFADVGAVPQVKGAKRNAQAQSGEDLKRLLREGDRYVFTLIQKFHNRDGQPYPVLSTRNNIIVITDEAHRSQYDTFAANMRRALPNAAFIGFTGTPLMAGEEKTKQVFGEYISVYNFKQSVEDGATVPLYYENRIPHLELTNKELNAHMEELLDEAAFDDAQEAKLEREFAREYHLITREDRLDEIAKDIAEHYAERGFAGRDYNSKAMVVCIDKLTAVRMYEKVQQHWQAYQSALKARIASTTDAELMRHLNEQIQFMQTTDMAVVISQSQNEIDDFRQKGFDIIPHRERMVRQQLDVKFKKPDDPLRMVFVCAMWMTGFDAPSCSTIYLDKPMRNHTLMQTIARANRVFKEKRDGLIVDYIGVFRNLEQALAIYGSAVAVEANEGEMPIQKKAQRIEQLRQKVAEANAFCQEIGIDLGLIQNANGFERIKLKTDAVEAILANEATKEQFLNHVREVRHLYKSILPHPSAANFYPTCKLLTVIAQQVLSESNGNADISSIQEDVEDLLDDSIFAEDYVIEASVTDVHRRVDLSQIDFDALKARFEQGQKNIATEKLRGVINRKLQKLVRQNRTRMNYLETFQGMIDEYNAGSVNVDVMFDRLIKFIDELDEEEQRTIAEQLSEEELAIFDLLTEPAITLSGDEREAVKKAARELLDKLKREKLVLDWRKRQQTKEAVRQSIEQVLDEYLPSQYEKPIFEEKCQYVYQHIYESYFGQGESIYTKAA